MRHLWTKPLVRKIAAVAILIAAVLLQLFFKNIPWPLEIDSSDKLGNPTAALGAQEFVLSGAVVMPKHEFLLYEGNAWEVADIDFSSAELDPSTAAILALSKDGAPPSRVGPWHYVTFDKEGSSGGEPCRTFIHVNLENASAASGEFHLYQLGRPGLNHFRQIEIKADSARLIVDAKSEAPDPAKPGGLGCWKNVQSDKWKTEVRNFPVRFAANANSSVRITFVSESPNGPSWGGPENRFKAAQLGPLLAHGLTLRSIQEDGAAIAKAPPALQLSAYRNSTLKIKDFQLGSEEIKVGMTGKAWLKEDGKRVGFDLLDAAMKNPTITTIVGACNTLLLAFLRKLFFDKPEVRQESTIA